MQKGTIKDEVLNNISALYDKNLLQETLRVVLKIYEGEKLLGVMKELLQAIPEEYEHIRKPLVDKVIRNQML
ncbi:MAG: hypothetical protein AB8D52_12755 [Gammaproteobacteria bacterium]